MIGGGMTTIDWLDPDWGGHVHEASYLDAEQTAGDQ